MQPSDMSAVDLVTAVRQGDLTALRATEAFLERIERLDGQINAFLAVDREGALRTAAAVDAKLNNLGAEIAALRAEARREEEAEAVRLRQETEADIAKLQAHAAREIAAAAKAARTELKRYSADLALQLAGQKALARMNPETDAALVRGFVRRLSN